jgi:hypothetical protein
MTHTKDEALKLLDALRVKYSDVIYDISPHLAAQFENGIASIEQALAAPTVQEPVAYRSRLASGNYTYCTTPQFFDNAQPLYTTPPAAAVQEGRDWSLLEATQESLREHMAEIKRLKEAQPAVPDALNPKDENPAYVAGWNDCRAEMLKGMK